MKNEVGSIGLRRSGDTIQGDGTKLGGMRRKLTEKATLGSRHGGSGADPHSNLT